MILYLPFWHCLIKLLFLPCLFIYFPICILLLHVLLSPFRFSSSALSSSFLYLCTASTLSLPLASCLLTHTFFHRLKLYIGILQVLHFCQISSAPSWQFSIFSWHLEIPDTLIWLANYLFFFLFSILHFHILSESLIKIFYKNNFGSIFSIPLHENHSLIEIFFRYSLSLPPPQTHTHFYFPFLSFSASLRHHHHLHYCLDSLVITTQ